MGRLAESQTVDGPSLALLCPLGFQMLKLHSHPCRAKLGIPGEVPSRPWAPDEVLLWTWRGSSHPLLQDSILGQPFLGLQKSCQNTTPTTPQLWEMPSGKADQLQA